MRPTLLAGQRLVPREHALDYRIPSGHREPDGAAYQALDNLDQLVRSHQSAKRAAVQVMTVPRDPWGTTCWDTRDVNSNSGRRAHGLRRVGLASCGMQRLADGALVLAATDLL